MKCPKCDYLGFETGDRCKNCGYDFSLSEAPEPELQLHAPESDPLARDRWLNTLEARLDSVRPAAGLSPTADQLGAMTLDAPVAPAPVAAAPLRPAATVAAAPSVAVMQRSTERATAPALPLFQPNGAEWDEPLIKVPSAPRTPLAVRRTPDKPRLRSVPRPVHRRHADSESDPVLAFTEEGVSVPPPAPAAPPVRLNVQSAPRQTEVCGAARRLTAAAVDHLILLSIDAVVIYFTFQIAGLPFSSWTSIPLLPLALFLLMVKGSYFCVFTALGGQTVGKMATGIRVIADNDRSVEPSRALQRTLAALASVATVGIGFAPVLFAGDRRALHDRVAGTRVVGPLHE
jgi:uncharacterized RDD family membrane protein YckC